jgi:hypothetical protein
MTKKTVNLHLVGQWTVIVIGLVSLWLRIEHRLTTVEVLQRATDIRVTRVEEKMDRMLNTTMVTDAAESTH